MGACGWCESLGECLTGSSSGARDTFCFDWRYYGSDCSI